MDNYVLSLFLDDGGLNLNVVENMANILARPLPLLAIEPKHRLRRSEDCFENIVLNYDDVSFYEHFGLQRQSAEEFVQLLTNVMLNPDSRMAPLRKKFLFSLWVLSKQESFSATTDRFGMPVSSGYVIFKEIIAAIVDLIPQFIIWPNTYEATAAVFQNRSREFQGIVGCIGCCHIRCKQPVGNPVDYYNRKGFHSIVLQGTCDHQGKFIDVFIGSPGRMHDSSVFRNSPLFQKMLQEDFIPPEFHLVGDATYPLKLNMMTPFPYTGHLTPAQTRYNTKLRTARSTIERAFDHLKGKFKRLKYLNVSDFELANSMIGAACVLHNFIKDRDVDEEEIPEPDVNIPDNIQLLQEEAQFIEMAAIQKRNRIVELFA